MIRKIILKYSPIIIICAVVFYEFGRIVFDPRPIILGEALSIWATPFSIMSESIFKYGQVSLWSNNLGAGFSTIGYPYFQNLYPLVYPFLLLLRDSIISLRFFIFFHIILAGCFFYLFARYIKVLKSAALFGSITYLSSWFFLSYIVNGFFSSLLTYTWSPLFFLFLVKAVRENKLKYAAISGLILALTVTAGGLYSIIFLFLLAITFLFTTLISALITRKPAISRAYEAYKIFKVLVVLLMSFVMSAAVKLLPILEYRNISIRESVTLYQAESNLNSVTSVLNEILKKPLMDFFWTPGEETGIFIAFFYITIFLSIFSKKRFILAPFLLFTIISFIGAMGNRFIVDIYALFYYLVPGFQSIQYTTRFLILIWFLLPFLSMLGCEVIEQSIKRNVQLKVVFLIFTFFFLASIILNQKKQIESYPLIYYEEPVASSYFKNTFKDIKTFRIFNKWISGPHSASTYAAIQNDLELVNPVHENIKLKYKFSGFKTSEKDRLIQEKRYKILGILNTKYIVSPEELRDPENPFTRLQARIEQNGAKGYIDENLIFRDRLSFIPSGILLIDGDRSDSFGALKARSILLLKEYNIKTTTIFSGKSPYLEDYNPEILELFEIVILNDVKVKNKQVFDERIRIFKEKSGVVLDDNSFKINSNIDGDAFSSLLSTKPFVSLTPSAEQQIKSLLINTKEVGVLQIISEESGPGNEKLKFRASKAGFLVFSDTYYPGWEATLDGKMAELFMADSIVKGIVIPNPGEHEVKFTYRPKSFLLGGILSIGTIFVILLLTTMELYKFKRKAAGMKSKK